MSRQQQSALNAHQIRQNNLIHPQIIPISGQTTSNHHQPHPQSRPRSQHRPRRPAQSLAPPPVQTVTNGRVSGPVHPDPTAAPTMHPDIIHMMNRMNSFMDDFSGLIRSSGSHRITQSDQSQSRNLNASSSSSSDAEFNVKDEVLTAVETSHIMQLRALKKVGERVGRLEKSIGFRAGNDQWAERLAAIEGAVRVLARDYVYTRAPAPAPSGSPLPVSIPIQTREIGTSPPPSPRKSYADAATSPGPPSLPDGMRYLPLQRIETEIENEGGDETDENEELYEALLARVRVSADALATATGNGSMSDEEEWGRGMEREERARPPSPSPSTNVPIPLHTPVDSSLLTTEPSVSSWGTIGFREEDGLHPSSTPNSFPLLDQVITPRLGHITRSPRANERDASPEDVVRLLGEGEDRQLQRHTSPDPGPSARPSVSELGIHSQNAVRLREEDGHGHASPFSGLDQSSTVSTGTTSTGTSKRPPVNELSHPIPPRLRLILRLDTEQHLSKETEQNKSGGEAESEEEEELRPFGPVDWSTGGVRVYPRTTSSFGSSTKSSGVSMTSASTPNSYQLQDPPIRHLPIRHVRPLPPARDIPDGSIAALRRAVLGDHLFVRPLEDVRIGGPQVVEGEDENMDGDVDMEGDEDMDEDEDYGSTKQTYTPMLSPLTPPSRSISPWSESVPALPSLSPSPDYMGINMEFESLESDVNRKSLVTPDTTPVPSSLSSPWLGASELSVGATTVSKWALARSGSSGMEPGPEHRPEVEMDESEEEPLTPLSILEFELGLGRDGEQVLDASAEATSNTWPESEFESEQKRPDTQVELRFAKPEESDSGGVGNLDLGETEVSLGPGTAASISPDTNMSRGKRRKSITGRKQRAKKMKMEVQTEMGKTDSGVTCPRAPPLARGSKRSRGRGKSGASGSASFSANGRLRSHQSWLSCDPDLVFDWPAKLDGDDQSFIGCDNCQQWYHFMCVGVFPDQIAEDEVWFCPPCFRTPAKRKTERNCDDTCGRPDCSFPGHAKERGQFTIDKIVGRKHVGSTTKFKWLVKWLRYPITAATWEPEESMGNLAVLIKRFNQDVMEEGLDPNKNDMILLNEAVLGGWLESDSEDS